MIRQATKADVAAILAIYNEAIEKTTAVYTYKPQSLAEREQWFEAKMASGFPIFVFDDEGAVAGFATYGAFRDWPAYKYTVEHSIYVDARYRRKGMATQLLKALIEDATTAGYRTIVAGIDAANQDSIALHEKFGFVHTGTLQQVGYKFNQWLDLAFYQLLLAGPAQPTED